VVKSTDTGSTADFDQQNSLYTICVRGIKDGEKIEQNIVSSSISRVLTAGKDWEEILDFAASPSLELIISNTTEVGIQLVEDDVHAYPPVSYPGKLLAVLFHRYKMYNGSEDRGLVIIPTELIPDNATKLKDILLVLARKNQMPAAFITWLLESNTFCNSLVDRIVPGKPDKTMLAEIEDQLGYTDDLLTMSEVYSLWAIEGDEKVEEKLSFAKVDKGVIVTPDINLHRELKLRLLNGTHTLSSGIAFLAGFDTVKQAMDNQKMEAFISSLMKSEIANAIPYEVTEEITNVFSNNVLDRFRNPHIKHQWLSITMNFTSKLKMRVVPLLLNYYKKHDTVPELMAFGFAAYINFMHGEEKDGKFYGSLNGSSYHINDDKAAYVKDIINKSKGTDVAKAILSDTILW
ncbi:MAG: tagaturonate reductase, partial [Pedobacter sp.]